MSSVPLFTDPVTSLFGTTQTINCPCSAGKYKDKRIQVRSEMKMPNSEIDQE